MPRFSSSERHESSEVVDDTPQQAQDLDADKPVDPLPDDLAFTAPGPTEDRHIFDDAALNVLGDSHSSAKVSDSGYGTLPPFLLSDEEWEKFLKVLETLLIFWSEDRLAVMPSNTSLPEPRYRH
jgi:hypothetical protein